MSLRQRIAVLLAVAALLAAGVAEAKETITLMIH